MIIRATRIYQRNSFNPRNPYLLQYFKERKRSSGTFTELPFFI